MCYIFCGKANSLVLLRKRIPTAFDLECLKQIIDRKAKKKDEGSRRKDNRDKTSRQEHRTFIKENKLTKKHTMEKR